MEDIGVIMDSCNIESLEKKIDDFIEKYEYDMRGDMNSANGGRHGLISNLREVRRYQKDYPSLDWKLAHEPVKTWAKIVGVFVALTAFMGVGLLNIFGSMIGINIP